MSKPFVCENDETAEVDKAGDNEVEASFQLYKKCELKYFYEQILFQSSSHYILPDEIIVVWKFYKKVENVTPLLG